MPRRKPEETPLCRGCRVNPARPGTTFWRLCESCDRKRVDERAKKLHRFAAEIGAARLEAAGVPERYLQASLDDFKGSVTVTWGKGFRLFGKPGTGKTHFLCAIAREAILLGSVRFWNLPALLDQLRVDIGGNTRQTLEEAVTVGFLLLDDLGTQRVTDFATEQLYTIINERYNRCLHTSVTGNDWRAIEARIQGRLKETTTEIAL